MKADIKALQELKREKDAEIGQLRGENAVLKAESDTMKRRLDALERLLFTIAAERSPAAGPAGHPATFTIP